MGAGSAPAGDGVSGAAAPGAAVCADRGWLRGGLQRTASDLLTALPVQGAHPELHFAMDAFSGVAAGKREGTICDEHAELAKSAVAGAFLQLQALTCTLLAGQLSQTCSP